MSEDTFETRHPGLKDKGDEFCFVCDRLNCDMAYMEMYIDETQLDKEVVKKAIEEIKKECFEDQYGDNPSAESVLNDLLERLGL